MNGYVVKIELLLDGDLDEKAAEAVGERLFERDFEDEAVIAGDWSLDPDDTATDETQAGGSQWVARAVELTEAESRRAEEILDRRGVPALDEQEGRDA